MLSKNTRSLLRSYARVFLDGWFGFAVDSAPVCFLLKRFLLAF